MEPDVANLDSEHPEPVSEPRPSRVRKFLPDHLARQDILLDANAGQTGCAVCGGRLHQIGESVSEMLDWVPAELRVLRIRRPKYACRACGTVTQSPAPERVIAGALATPAMLVQVLVSKYCDHTPLYGGLPKSTPSRNKCAGNHRPIA